MSPRGGEAGQGENPQDTIPSRLQRGNVATVFPFTQQPVFTSCMLSDTIKEFLFCELLSVNCKSRWHLWNNEVPLPSKEYADWAQGDLFDTSTKKMMQHKFHGRRLGEPGALWPKTTLVGQSYPWKLWFHLLLFIFINKCPSSSKLKVRIGWMPRMVHGVWYNSSFSCKLNMAILVLTLTLKET